MSFINETWKGRPDGKEKQNGKTMLVKGQIGGQRSLKKISKILFFCP